MDLRIAAGEAIVAVYELLWSVDDEFVGDDLDGLCAQLRQLATDSTKSRKKSDRKQQRCVFRDILHTFEVRTAARDCCVCRGGGRGFCCRA